jgi:hypothetical protein
VVNSTGARQRSSHRLDIDFINTVNLLAF